MNTAPIERQAGRPVHRRVEHVMGMPISVALRGRHASSAEGGDAWQAVIEQLREVDRVFSTYRQDSIIRCLDRGELRLGECPAEVAEVLDPADRQSICRMVLSRSSCPTVRGTGGSTPVESSRDGRPSEPHNSSPNWTRPISASPLAATSSATPLT
jgi:hypothetical protein